MDRTFVIGMYVRDKLVTLYKNPESLPHAGVKIFPDWVSAKRYVDHQRASVPNDQFTLKVLEISETHA